MIVGRARSMVQCEHLAEFAAWSIPAIGSSVHRVIWSSEKSRFLRLILLFIALPTTGQHNWPTSNIVHNTAHSQTEMTGSHVSPLVFTAADYLNIHPDVMNAYGPSGSKGAGDHWNTQGLNQGRQASLIFDPQYYLANNDDLRAKFGANGYRAALEHFLTRGLPIEGRRGSLEFDVKYYLQANPDVRAAYGEKGYMAAAQHFLNQGFPNEGRQGSRDFSVREYIAMYPDVAAAYGLTAYKEAVWHWLRRGKAQNRAGTGQPHSSADCEPNFDRKDYTRIFIALRSDEKAGTGTLDDPFDGSTAQKFDTILRSRSEAGRQNLVVCIGPGSFQTEGTADFVINIPHTSPRGFTVNRNWKIHGARMDRTILQLADFQPNAYGFPVGTAAGLVIGTHDDKSSGIEVSDLTIDDNYPKLKSRAMRSKILRINLDAMHLRSDEGGNYVHHVNVIHSSGEITEAFPIQIFSVNASVRSRNNVVEYNTFSDWGAGGCTAIALGNAIAEVRNNVVKDYTIAYGGWMIGAASFHDNFAINNEYGFNTDSLNNDGVAVQYNFIIHPRHYGLVIGGGGSYSNFRIEDNTVKAGNAIGLLFQGNVTNALVARNNFVVDGSGVDLEPIRLKRKGNRDNRYESNHLFTGSKVMDAQPKEE